MNREEILEATLVKFSDTPTLTLAKKLYNEHPEQFTSLEACRSMIRYRRGNNGKALLERIKSKKHVRKNGKAGFKLELPESIALPNDSFKLPQGRTGIMSDAHFPYHDKEAMEVTLKYFDDVCVDNILLNGDMADFFSVSRWEKNPAERNLSKELQLVRQFLGHLRERYPKARIIYKIGNHEFRWIKYLWLKAPEICGCEFSTIRSILDFSKWGIEEVGEMQKIKAGKNLTIIHGHEMFGATAPVNFARTLQTNLGACAIAGHRHQTSEHSFKTVEDKFITCWSLGCLCGMSPDYAPINKWNHGAALLDLDRNDFQVKNFRIINGEIR